MKPPYAQRIEAYCHQHGIQVPPGFHHRSACRYAIVDTSASPPRLSAVTYYLESWVIDYLVTARSASRQFRVLDFKRGLELAYRGGKHLEEIGTFEHRVTGEEPSKGEPAAD
jgi:hypothetical protein